MSVIIKVARGGRTRLADILEYQHQYQAAISISSTPASAWTTPSSSWTRMDRIRLACEYRARAKNDALVDWLLLDRSSQRTGRDETDQYRSDRPEGLTVTTRRTWTSIFFLKKKRKRVLTSKTIGWFDLLLLRAKGAADSLTVDIHACTKGKRGARSYSIITRIGLDRLLQCFLVASKSRRNKAKFSPIRLTSRAHQRPAQVSAGSSNPSR